MIWTTIGATLSIPLGYYIIHYTNMFKSRKTIIEELDGDLITKNNKKIKRGDKELRVTELLHTKRNKLPLLMFVHGFGGQSSQWRNQIEYFYSEYNVVAFDLLGHGLSGDSKNDSDYNIDSLSQDLIYILKRYSKEYEIILIGHSFGTLLITYTIQKYEIEYNKVILICPIHQFRTKQKWILFIPTILLSFIRMFDRISGLNSNSVNRVIYKDSNEIIRYQQYQVNYTSKSQTVQLMLKNNNNFKLSIEQFKNIYNVDNTMLILGKYDKLVDQSILNTGLDHFIIDNCAHNPMLEKSQELNGLIEKFINKK